MGKEREECPLVLLGRSRNQVANLGKCVSITAHCVCPFTHHSLRLYSCRPPGLGEALTLEPIKEFKFSPSESPVFKTAVNPNSSALEFKSPTTLLAQDLSNTLQMNSPALPQRGGPVTKSGLYSTKSFISSARRFQSTREGLNTILDGSPDSPPKLVSHKKIRRSALRDYYGNSVNSPNPVGGLLSAELQRGTERISWQSTGGVAMAAHNCLTSSWCSLISILYNYGRFHVCMYVCVSPP